jgi:hypothetical protein
MKTNHLATLATTQHSNSETPNPDLALRSDLNSEAHRTLGVNNHPGQISNCKAGTDSTKELSHSNFLFLTFTTQQKQFKHSQALLARSFILCPAGIRTDDRLLPLGTPTRQFVHCIKNRRNAKLQVTSWQRFAESVPAGHGE